MSEVELLAPAGNFETALAAFEAGADAVYCGLTEFSARAFADNFGIEELKNLLRYARGREQTPAAPQSSGNAESFGPDCGAPGVRPLPRRVYVTFNTVIDEDNLESAIEQLARLDEVRPDALIVQDLGVARICRKHFPDLELHASTQLVAHNLEGVLALKELGFKRAVLARELSLEEIASIQKRCGDMELEVFIHGALCYSISGLCLFGAMEKGRSGNRGKCPYCCRQQMEVDRHCSPSSSPSPFASSCYPFSMKDLRLGEDVRKLAQLGVASLKIEGRMKSALYVASVTQYYRNILGGDEGVKGKCVSLSDLETVFSRRTTKLYFDGRKQNNSPVDSESLGHRGTPVGTVKRITKDREGRSWLRFHTMRALEKHDGLQFDALTDEGRHFGFGISEMRRTISRAPVFEVAAGADVEVLLPDAEKVPVRAGDTVYCSMSNAVKRMFPSPTFRPSDYEGGVEIGVEVGLAAGKMSAITRLAGGAEVVAEVDCELQPAKNPEKTGEGVRKAFSKLGGSDYRLGKLTVNDPKKLFAPMSLLNDLRRDLVERLDAAREKARREKVERALGDEVVHGLHELHGLEVAKRVKVRLDQKVPPGDWGEVIVAINADDSSNLCNPCNLWSKDCRLALPVYTAEPEFNKLRVRVKGLVRAGFAKWECSDLATLRMLREIGVTDVTADWTLYAFNSAALAELAELGVKRFVASPENDRENLQYLAESGYPVEFLVQQSTPLFISLHRPAAPAEGLAVFERDGLWVTVRPVPRTFALPVGASSRVDLSWDA